MKNINFSIRFIILSILFFSIPSTSISKPLLYGGTKDEGKLAVFDPICMVTVLEIKSYCSMDHQDSTGSSCTCHNQLRTFSGFVVTRLEYEALCGSWPLGSCSDLDPSPESTDEPQKEHLTSKPEIAPQPDNSTPPDDFNLEVTDTRDELSKLRPDNPTVQQNDFTELIDSRHTTLATPQKPVSLSPIKPDQLELDDVRIDFAEILRKHPLRKFKKPNLIEIIKGLKRN